MGCTLWGRGQRRRQCQSDSSGVSGVKWPVNKTHGEVGLPLHPPRVSSLRHRRETQLVPRGPWRRLSQDKESWSSTHEILQTSLPQPMAGSLCYTGRQCQCRSQRELGLELSSSPGVSSREKEGTLPVAHCHHSFPSHHREEERVRGGAGRRQEGQSTRSADPASRACRTARRRWVTCSWQEALRDIPGEGRGAAHHCPHMASPRALCRGVSISPTL